MRVALVSTEFPPSVDGGAGTYAGHLATELAATGIDLTVIGPTEAAEYAGPHYRFIGVSPHAGGLLRFWSKLALDRKGKDPRHSFDLIHSNGIAGLPLVVGSRSAATVATIHHVTRALVAPGIPGMFQRVRDLRGETGVVPFAERLLVHRSDCLIAVSRTTSESLAHYYPATTRKASVVYSGVELNGASAATSEDVRKIRARFNPSGEPLLLTVARLEHRKGIDVLITAFASLHRQGVRARLVIVGAGRRRHYEDLARRLRCDEQIGFVERMGSTELAAMYWASDLVVVPSRHEGFGFVALEAMGAGKPVVVTRTGAAKDGVIDDTCGAVVEVGDDLGLSAAIERLVLDPAGARAIGARNRLRVGRMSWRATAKATIGVYEDAIIAARFR